MLPRAAQTQFVPYELDARLLQVIGERRVRIPPYPAVAARLGEMLGRDNYQVSEVVQIVGGDPALSASVLRYANSPAVRGNAPVRSLPEAIARMGTQSLARLAFAAGLGASVGGGGVLLPLRRRAWRRAVYCAELCRELARMFRLDEGEAFVWGLLHDFGHLVAYAALEEIMAGAARGARVSAARCQLVAQCYHVELGLLMAESWKLPESVRRVIAEHHHAPEDGTVASPVKLVALVDGLVDRVELGLTLDEVVEGVPMPATAGFLIENALAALPATLQGYDPEMGTALLEAQADVLERPATSLGGEPRPAMFHVVCRGRRYRGLAIAEDGLVVSGRPPLPEQVVLDLQVESARGSLAFWGVVPWRVHGREETRMEIKPCAMDRETAARWRAIVPHLGA